MNAIDVHRWSNPSNAELDRAVELLMAAFKEDPFTALLSENDPELVAPEAHSHLMMGLSDGEVYVAGLKDAPEDIAAVAVWYGPGCDFLHTEEQRAARDRDFNNRLSASSKHWFDDIWAPKWETLHVNSLGPQHSERSLAAYHVALIGVHPAMQRKGLGRALMNVVISKADQEAVEVILEASGEVNIAFYESLGFTMVGEPVAIPYKDGDEPFVCFVRPAKSAQSSISARGPGES